MGIFSIFDTPIAGLMVIERKEIGDDRGFLARIFCSEELKCVGWKKPIAQINQTITKKKGTVRGMHYQNYPYAEMKLVSCLQGEVWDVAVDLRKNSPTFLNWHAEKLSAKNGRALLIPEGFAHGFQTLADDCELIYAHSAPYRRDSEGGIHPEDARLSIPWPLNFSEISTRDSGHPLLNDQFIGFNL
ncbi:dTDP-4-dehydrorhamnose 3,5-epimerase [Polynucleobacter tropicus]|uniref:dTDP-4-dehydrorhamnose 3,5-epimerase n=1 Tax=Polynucleobacter tropicus TaxID=1743174 RepID=A0A6M9Q5R9_9BURK|nr:dTDP-4-dehydrorhamnose 3,5-epimerase [Polynucleobacter tropicus]QKM64043.1 dTDP-4-dehydrorhamnose 3,5-epimerase [Polynucleobacter tropicus]